MNKHLYRIVFNPNTGATIRSRHPRAPSGLAIVLSSVFEAQLSAQVGSRFSFLALTIALLCGDIHAAFAQIQADPHAAGNHRPVIDNTANGLPLVQIATPNAAGVSHNQYQQFNVDPQGAVLNNASSNVNTQLGGWVGGNPNLSNGGAHLILNEVTSANPSALRGYIEVAGQRADVVIANPNGVVLDGAGFINTSRATITTGVPVFAGNSALDGFRVTQGNIQVGAGGFNDSYTDQVDLIARSVKVNGALYATRLNVVAGANQVNYNGLGVQLIQGADNAPTVAIDVAALGGMYANSIFLVGTEAGVGVRSYGKMAATAGDFTLDAAGKITLTADASATGKMRLASSDSIVNDAKLSSGGDMDLQAANAIDNHGKQLLSGGNLSMRSASLNNTGGTIHTNRSANVALHSNFTNAQGDMLTAAGDLAVNTTGNFVNHNDLTAGGNLSVHAANIDNGKDGLLSAGQTALLQADHAITNTGRVYGQDIVASAQSITNDHEGAYGDGTPAGVIASRNTLTIGAKAIVNREHALIKSAGDMAFGGALDANNQATGTATSITNSSASIDSGANLAIASAALTNTNAHWATEIRQDDSKTRHVTEYEFDGVIYTPAQANIHEDDGLQKMHVTGQSPQNDWTRRNYTETTRTTVVTSSDPARLLAGGDMHLSGDVTNDKSAIVAGGTLSGQTGDIHNIDVKGASIVHRQGTSTWHSTEKKGLGSRHDTWNDSPLNYDQPTTHFDMNLWQASAHTTSQGIDNPSNAPTIAQLLPNQFYQPVTDPALPFVIQTDPAYIDALRRQFLSSDYQLGRMTLDPTAMQQRLGDGYYEQQLINDQILQLTGHKMLGTYASNEDQYKALMDTGVAYAQQFQLAPGIALSAAQMAALTTDMVWLVEKNITLADGSTQKVLAPVVYLSQLHARDVKPDGALIAADDIDLKLNGTLDNAGTLKATRNLVVQAGQDINNTLGTIGTDDQNGTTTLTAGRDINDASGMIAGNRVGMLAGRDINVRTLTTTATGNQGTQIGLDRQGSIQAGSLTAQAQRDVNLDAANINTTGDATIAAGNDLNLHAVKTQEELNVTYDDKNQLYKKQEQVTGTTIQSGGNTSLAAVRDLNSQAAYVSADQALTAVAGNNVNEGTATQDSHYDQETYSHSSGLLSSSSKHVRDQRAATQSVGSTLSGDSVTVQAGKDINVSGSNIVSTTGTNLAAGNNINIVTSQNTAGQAYRKEEKQSGVFSGGGIGVTLGSRSMENEQTSKQVTNNASTVGSTNGNVNIAAGKTYTQTGSNVVAPEGDITIAAKRVDINAAHDTSDSTQDTHFKQSGITLQVTNPVISAVQGIQQMKQASSRTKDKRMQGLAAGAAALTAANTVAQVSGSAAPAGGIDLAVSIGGSKSQSHSEQHSSTVVGSTTAAGKNVSIAATGAGQDSNLTIQGSDVTAGHNTTLHADHDINLLADQSTNEQRSNNSGSSASIGVSVGSSGFMVNASASGSRGHGDGNDVTQTNSHVSAGDQLAMASGGDTNIKGATASGKQVTADVGGNLYVESLQDTSHYDSRQQSLGGSISAGTGFSGSINASNSKVNGDYVSVQEQSGIQAGDDGFNVNVKGNTDLNGGQIASTDTAVDDGKNTFNTASLTASDIQNKSDYEAESKSFSAGAGYQGGNTAMNGGGIGIGHAGGHDASTTTSGVSGLAGDTTVRSDKDGSGKLAKNWDGQQLQQDVEAQTQITEAFGKQAGQAIGDYASRQLKKAIDAGDADGIKHWSEGGAYRVALHTLAGGLAGGVAGAAGAATSAATIADIGKAINQLDLPDAVKKGLIAAAGTAVGGAVGGASGAASGFNQTANNYLKHDEIDTLAKARKACPTGSGSSRACGEVQRLEALDKQRDVALDVCSGNTSSACNAVRQDVRQAAADIIRYGNAKTDLLNNNDNQHTIYKADGTLSNIDHAAGAATGLAKTTADGVAALASGLGTLLKGAYGDEAARDKIENNVAQIYVTLGRLAGDPDLLAQMINHASKEQRDVLANAYEKGDAFAIGQMAGSLLANVVPLPIGTIGKVGKIETALEDAGKIANAARKIEEVAKGANTGLNVGEGVVASRVNIRIGDANITGSGLEYAWKKHGGAWANNKSAFTISRDELRVALQDPLVVNTPAYQSATSGNYIRTVDMKRTVGIDAKSGGQPTNFMTVITDSKGNLVNTFPGKTF